MGQKLKHKSAAVFKSFLVRGVQGRGKEVFKVSKIFHCTVHHDTCKYVNKYLSVHIKFLYEVPEKNKEITHKLVLI